MRIRMRIREGVPLLPMPIAQLPLPLAQSKSKLKGRVATNLYLRRVIKAEGAQVAKVRYGYSLSEMVDRLLELEVNGKKGLIEMAMKNPLCRHRLFRLNK